MTPVTIRKYDNQLLVFLPERCDPTYARRRQPSVESPSDLAELMNAVRRRVVEAKAERARSDAVKEAGKL